MALFDSPLTAGYASGHEVAQQQNVQRDTQVGSQMSQFNPAQLNLQNQAIGGLSSFIQGGSVPQQFGLPQAAWDSATYNWQKTAAPGLAARFGAGSPVIDGSYQELLLHLAGMSGQQASSNYLGALDAASAWAFRPIGENSAQAGTQTANMARTTDYNKKEINADLGGALGAGISLLGNLFRP